MKKIMTSTMALLLCLSMLFSFAACGGDNGNGGEQTVVGKWACDMDVADMYNEMLGASMGVTIDKFEMRLVFEFAENGDASMELDREHFSAQIPGLVDTIVNSMVGQLGMDADAFYSMSGMTRDQFIQQMEEQLDAGLAQTSIKGKYEIEDNKLWILKDGQSKTDSDPMLFSFEGGNMLLTAEGEADVPEMLKDYLPLTLTRI